MSFPFIQPELSPEAEAAIDAYYEAVRRWQTEERKIMLHWAALVCSCSPYFGGYGAQPPQSGCPVHGNVLLMRDGSWL